MYLILLTFIISYIIASVVNIILYRNIICIKYRFVPTMIDLLCCVCPILNLGYLVFNIATILKNTKTNLARKILFIKGE